MANLIIADRVKVTTSSTGTGALTIGASVLGFRDISAVATSGDTLFYVIAGGSEWETGIGRYNGTQLERSAAGVLSSSNAGSLVNFSAGTKTIAVSQPAFLAQLLFGGSVAAVAIQNSLFRGYFGDGRDGDLIVEGNSGLDSDRQYRRVIVRGDGLLNTNGYLLKCWILDLSAGSTLPFYKPISNVNSSSNTIGGTDSQAGGKGGAAITAAGNGNPGTSAATPVGGVGGAGGSGGGGGNSSTKSGGAGGTGGSATGSFAVTGVSSFLKTDGSIQTAFAAIEGGAGAGGGGGGARDAGGNPALSSGVGGGASGGALLDGGGVVAIFAAITIVSSSTPAGAISACGVAANNAGIANADVSAGGGGGAGGAGGGYIVFAGLARAGAKTGLFDASGLPGTTGGAGATGGAAGGGGKGGGGGRIDIVDFFTDTVTTTTGTAGGSPSGVTGGTGGACVADL